MNNLPKRRPNRLMSYDYGSNGAYFITICTHKRVGILSQMCRGGDLLLPIGRIAENEIINLQNRYEILIDKYVVMPNHVHMIVSLNYKREEQSPSPTIPDIVCAYKSIVTKLANKNDNTPGRQIFQRSYHDHVIRNQDDYKIIWKYIDENTLKWEEDCFYIENL